MTCWMAAAFAIRSAPLAPIGVRLTPARGVPPTAQSRPKDDPTEDPVLDKIEADLRRAARGELERPSRRAWYDSGRKTGLSALWAAAYAFVFRYPFIRSTLLGEKQIGPWPPGMHCGLTAQLGCAGCGTVYYGARRQLDEGLGLLSPPEADDGDELVRLQRKRKQRRPESRLRRWWAGRGGRRG